MMRFFIKTFGCQMNVNDSEKMRHLLQKQGWQAAADEMEADLLIINSCAVREKAQSKIFSYIGRWGADKKVVVAGCVAQSERDSIMRLNTPVHFVVGTHQFYHLAEIISQWVLKGKKGSRTQFSRDWQEVVPMLDSRQSRVTGYISIMEGCNNFCSYCIVPFTRGREKHRPVEQILQEAEFLAHQGYQEIVLLGQNVNNWQDREQSLRFSDLLALIAGRVRIPWIRFITSYPGYHDRELIDVMSRYPSIARHIHFPAQSGSTRILKKMNRIYTRDQYLAIIRQFMAKVPGMRFSSDFIVGFPGESDHDFKLTLSLLERIGYESVFSFVYSPRKFTKASHLADDIPIKVKKDRLYQLQDLQEKIQLANNKKLLGQTVKVLITEPHPKKVGEMIGRTESYRVVNVKSTAKPGEFINIKIERAGPHSLRGREV
jgi:tRNA-2-methylthio-N6-dimethylallyladenosine synthase